jgi:hypothetical protein
MQGKQRQQIASKIRQLQQDNVVHKNDDEFQIDFKLDAAAAKELVEAEIVIAQILMDFMKRVALKLLQVLGCKRKNFQKITIWGILAVWLGNVVPFH